MDMLYVPSSSLVASKFLERDWFYCYLAKGSTGIKGLSHTTNVHLKTMFNPPLAAEHMRAHAHTCKKFAYYQLLKDFYVYLRHFFVYFFKAISSNFLSLKAPSSPPYCKDHKN